MADYIYVVDSGIIVPDTADVIADVEAEFKAALGNDLNTDPSTPQGALITGEVAARTRVLQNNAEVANQFNPSQSGGIFLASLCRLTGFDPPQATFTEVSGVVLAGAPGFTISAGSQAKTAAGDLFQLTGNVTLDGSGNGVGAFQALVAGAVPCAAHALTIATAVLGWETIDNPTKGLEGQDAPTDAQLRTLRQNTLGVQGVSLPEAITSALYDTPGVLSLQFRENIANIPQTIDGIVMAAHSIWACVDGGTDLDVATAILSAKSMGAGFNGGVTVNVTEPASGQVYPVQFARPTHTRLYARATIRNGTITGDAITIVKDDLVAYGLGQVTSFPGFVVGADASPFELAMSIGVQTPGAFVVKMEVSLDGATWQTTELVNTIDHQFTLAPADITVAFV